MGATETTINNPRLSVSATTLGGVGAAYAYDAAGNCTAIDWEGAASAYAANGLNQYVSVVSGGATNALVHDAWGNLTDTRHFSFSFAYAENLPVGIRTNRTSGATSLASYYYDGLRRRVSSYVTPPGGQNRSHRYYYSGWSLQLETAQNNAPYSPTQTSYNVWGSDLSGTLDGAGGGGGLLTTEVDGTWYFPLYDNNGNVTDYVSEDGEVVASYAYDAFGRTIAQSGSMADVFPFRFSTKYYDAETGLYYYGYRYYSPELGRWLTRDPIEEDGGDNLYAFCGNNGVSMVDSFGKAVFLVMNREDDVYEQNIAKCKEVVNKALSILDKMGKRHFDKLVSCSKIAFNGELFFGSFVEFRQLISRELLSCVHVESQYSPSIANLQTVARKADQSYDLVAYCAHGSIWETDKSKVSVFFSDCILPQSSVIEAATKAMSSAKGAKMVISCYQTWDGKSDATKTKERLKLYTPGFKMISISAPDKNKPCDAKQDVVNFEAIRFEKEFGVP